MVRTKHLIVFDASVFFILDDCVDREIACFENSNLSYNNIFIPVFGMFHFFRSIFNLVGTDSDWRDTTQTKPAPLYLEKLKVKIYTDFPVKEVCLASPDTADLTVRTLPYETGSDADGTYLGFTLPALAYWDMVFLR